MENNVIYGHIGHGIVLEDGFEQENIITDNLVMKGRRPEVVGGDPLDGDHLLVSEVKNEPQNRSPAAFWITNPYNTIEDNVAAGSEGTGYWFALPQSPIGESATNSYLSERKPSEQSLGSFKRNKAHSIQSGFDIFDQLQNDQNDTGSQTTKNDLVKNRGWDNAADHIFEDFTAYACEIGIYCGLGVLGPVKNNIFDNAMLVDNGFNLFPGRNVFWRYYDGPGRVIDSHLVGFNNHLDRVMFAQGGAGTFPGVHIEGLSTDHSEILNWRGPVVSLIEDPKKYSTTFYAADNTLTGTAGRSVVPDHPFLFVSGNEVRPAGWENFVQTDHRYGSLYLKLPLKEPSKELEPFPQATVKRTKASTPTAYAYGPFDDNPETLAVNDRQQFPVIVNEGFLYTVKMAQLPTQGSITIMIRDGRASNTPGDHYLVCFKEFGKLGGVKIEDENNAEINPVTSFEDVKSATVHTYYVEPNGDLYYKFVQPSGQPTDASNLYIKWETDIQLGLLDTDGDSVADYVEAQPVSGDLVTNAFDPGDAFEGFETDTNYGAWDFLRKITNHSVSNSHLTGTSTGIPKIFNDSVNFPASSVERIYVTMKADQSVSARMRWQKSSTGTQWFSSPLVPYAVANEWQTLIIEVGSETNWADTITKLRLEPTNANNVTFHIDSIAFSNGDIDGDGIPDSVEIAVANPDVDADGLDNYIDTDSDGDGASDEDEDADPLGDPYDAGDLHFDFDTDANDAGFVVNNVKSINIAGGTYSGVSNGGLTRIKQTGLHFDTTQVDTLFIRMKANDSRTVAIRFKTWDPVTKIVSGYTAIAKSYSQANQWQTLEFNLSSKAEWEDCLYELLIDPLGPDSQTNDGDTFEIDWISATNLSQ